MAILELQRRAELFVGWLVGFNYPRIEFKSEIWLAQKFSRRNFKGTEKYSKFYVDFITELSLN